VEHVPDGKTHNSDRFWVLVRMILGMAQITGAATALLLLVHTGLNGIVLGVALFTCVLTTTSVLLFGGASRQKRKP